MNRRIRGLTFIEDLCERGFVEGPASGIDLVKILLEPRRGRLIVDRGGTVRCDNETGWSLEDEEALCDMLTRAGVLKPDELSDTECLAIIAARDDFLKVNIKKFGTENWIGLAWPIREAAFSRSEASGDGSQPVEAGGDQTPGVK